MHHAREGERGENLRFVLANENSAPAVASGTLDDSHIIRGRNLINFVARLRRMRVFSATETNQISTRQAAVELDFFSRGVNRIAISALAALQLVGIHRDKMLDGANGHLAEIKTLIALPAVGVKAKFEHARSVCAPLTAMVTLYGTTLTKTKAIEPPPGPRSERSVGLATDGKRYRLSRSQSRRKPR